MNGLSRRVACERASAQEGGYGYAAMPAIGRVTITPRALHKTRRTFSGEGTISFPEAYCPALQCDQGQCYNQVRA